MEQSTVYKYVACYGHGQEETCNGIQRWAPVLQSRYILAGAGAGVKVRLWLHITVDETEEILNDIIFVRSNIDKRLIKKILKINDFF